MVDTITFACKEVHAGGYPGKDIKTALTDVWDAETAKPGFTHRTRREFDAMWLWAIPKAEADDPEKRRLIMARTFGMRHDAPVNNAVAGRSTTGNSAPKPKAPTWPTFTSFRAKKGK